MKVTLHHTINCSPEKFWSLYLDPDFTRRLHLEGAGSVSAEIVDQEGSAGGSMKRRLRFGQRPNAPGPVKKFFGDEVESIEEGTFDPQSGVWAFRITPGVMADKTTVGGTMKATDKSDGTSDLEFVLEAKVKVFGVGGVIEKFIERQAREQQDNVVKFVNANLP